MRKLYTTVLVAAATIAVTVMTGGSANAGDTTDQIVSPGPVMSRHSTSFQDDQSTGCGSHRARVTVPEATSTGM